MLGFVTDKINFTLGGDDDVYEGLESSLEPLYKGYKGCEVPWPND